MDPDGQAGKTSAKRAGGITVVVPCWNDAQALGQLLARLAGFRAAPEVVVADVSRGPHCRHLAQSYGAVYTRCSRPSRGAQMNLGAAVAGGSTYLFHHADSVLDEKHLDSVARAVGDAEVVGGAFHRDLGFGYPALARLDPIARFYNERFGVLYGDQSIFVRRRCFERLGGFADIPLMEDVEFSRRLRRLGRVALLDPPLRSSRRRFDGRGLLQCKLQNLALRTLYTLGVSPARLHHWYYRRSATAASDPAARTKTPV